MNAIEPLYLPSVDPRTAELSDMALLLQRESATLKAGLPPLVQKSLSELVRTMNCYYSNLIEGHNTHPVDIERALREDYSQDDEKRNLQLEAVAHVEVQKWLDEQPLSRSELFSTSLAREVHRRFMKLLPQSLLWTENPDTGERLRIEGGKLRERDVKVGHHTPPAPDEVPQLMQRWESVYGSMSAIQQIVHVAAAHHRLLYIHPFIDGNGRVARLMSHAQLNTLLDAGGLWSLSRGYARRVDAYRRHLNDCDQSRRNDLDGRGALSLEALIEFSRFTLEVALDQVGFMGGLIDPRRLSERVGRWAAEQIEVGTLPKRSDRLLAHLLVRGEITRQEAQEVLDVSERQARRIITALMDIGAIRSEHKRAPLKINMSESLASYWFPGLFPDQTTP